MSDNVFDRLLELLQSSGPVNWKLANEVAQSLSGKPEPVDERTADELRQLVRAAELHVQRAAGLDAVPVAEVHVVDRSGWAQDNLRSFSYLVDAVADKMGSAPSAGPLDAVLKPLAPALLGMQMGSMVGFMSHRVLGQFDIGMPALGASGLFFVATNIDEFARDHGIDLAQARLWVALHEVTHHAEFAVPWVGRHFQDLMSRYFEALEFDPGRIMEKLESLESPEQFEQAFSEPGGLAGMIGGPEQRAVLEEIQAFLALMEGYGDYLMDRAAPDLIPEASRIREAIHRRRAEPSQGEQVLHQLVGLELRRQQSRLGTAFCEDVSRRLGDGQLARIWEGPQMLPTLQELDDPVGWAARLLTDDGGAGVAG
jgi:putative hydrolase